MYLYSSVLGCYFFRGVNIIVIVYAGASIITYTILGGGSF